MHKRIQSDFSNQMETCTIFKEIKIHTALLALFQQNSYQYWKNVWEISLLITDEK